MKVIIRAEGQPAPQVTLATPVLRWDVRLQRLTMLRAIFDGFYDTPLEGVAMPIGIEAREGELHIVLAKREDVAPFAAALEDLAAFCWESYGQSWT